MTTPPKASGPSRRDRPGASTPAEEPPAGTRGAVVEPRPPNAGPPHRKGDLELRLRQQELLAKLGVVALQGTPMDALLDRAVAIAAEGMEAEYGKIMEYLPVQNRFIVRAGVGWTPGLVGSAIVGADLESPAGYALSTGQPVISNHLEHERRFRTPEMLRRHGVRRAINVILKGDKSPFGVLEVDSRSEGAFTAHDLAFLQGAANIIGMAIERQRIERDLLEAVETQKLLFEELNHRVKNSLQLAATTLELQAGSSDSVDLKSRLREASARIATIGRAYDGLYQSGKLLAIDLGRYLREICRGFGHGAGGRTAEIVAPDGIAVAANRAIPIALVVNELATNAIKYAYPEAGGGRVTIRLGSDGDQLVLSVRDYGAGLPADFDVQRSRGMGMRIVRALTHQLRATLDIRREDPGTEFILRLPVMG